MVEPGNVIEVEGYRNLFEQYVAAGVVHSLDTVRQDRQRVSEEVRVQAWHLLSFALRTPRAWPVTATLLLELSPKMQQAGYREQWLAYLEEGLVYSRATGDGLRTAALELEVGELLRHLGRLDAAQTCFNTALQTFAAAGDVIQTGAAKVCLANLAYLRERWLLALDLCGEVLAKILDLHFVRARALFVAANTRNSLHEEEEAERLFIESQTAWEELGEPQWAALCLQNRAWLASRRGDNHLARTLCAEALATFLELGALHSQAVVHQDWGIIEYLDGDMQAALLHYQEAEKIFRRLGDVLYLAMVCNNIGLVYRAEQQWDDAETCYAESVGLYRELGTILARINIDSGRGKLWLERGDAAKALAHFDRLLTDLQAAEESAERRRLHAEITEYRRQAAAALE
ncbi:MAG: tetratricopeptide repeat protein [Caldilineaceae bacterium]